MHSKLQQVDIHWTNHGLEIIKRCINDFGKINISLLR